MMSFYFFKLFFILTYQNHIKILKNINFKQKNLNFLKTRVIPCFQTAIKSLTSSNLIHALRASTRKNAI
jgi:hypothetical protein